jgi:phage terminase large subunit-like protein
MPWWGDRGRAPHLRYPGVTIEIPAVWSPARKRWESPDGRFYFDRDAADKACDFFPAFLTHHIGEFAGRPFELLDYQRVLLTRPLFGWKRASDGLRRFRKVFAFLPKGAGKSPWASGTGLYLAICDDEPAAEVYALANDKKQAGIVHGNAKIMVEESPDLAERCDVLRDAIFHRDSRSTYQVLSSDATGAHGFRPHGLIFDEFHGQPNRDQYEALKKSMPKRRQPVLIIVTHAGDDDEGICVAPETKLLTTDLRWTRACDVEVGDELVGFDEHRTGLNHRRWQRAKVLHKAQATLPSYRLTLTDGTVVTCSEDHMWLVQTAGRRVVWKKTKDLKPSDHFYKILDTGGTDESWAGGYLAGLFDSEGHLSRSIRARCLCGFTQVDGSVATLGQRLLTERGYRWGLYGGGASGRSARQTMLTRKRDVARLLGSIRPRRLLEKFQRIAYGAAGIRFKATQHPKLAELRFVGARRVIGLKTSTRTFIAEGLASHNCYEEYEGAKRVLSGTSVEESFLPVIFEAQPSDDWKDPELWRRVNPGHGITIKHDGIVMECQEAENEPRKLNDFLRFHLNRWVGQAVAWIPLDWWDGSKMPVAPDAELALLPCAAGLDMSQKIDLAAFVVACRHQLEGQSPAVEVVTGDGGPTIRRSLNYRITLVPFFWIPENTMREREKEDGVPYTQWVQAGLVTATEGDVIDYDRIFTDITERIAPRFPRLKQGEIGYDPAFATDIALRLTGAGFKVLEVLQNYQHLSEPSYLFEGLVKAARVAHGGHRVLRHHVENVAVKKDDAQRLKPVKPKKSRKRIDGVIASILALSRLAVLPDQPKTSRYARGGGAYIISASGVQE